jgi:hypothetical protein
MAISINGTTGISGVDGSASTPALQGNDSNTGISFGTDEVAINTGGTQRVLIDTSGNCGIGTSSPLYRLHLENTSVAEVGFNATGSGGGHWRLGTGHSVSGISGAFRFYDVTNAAERARITSGGTLAVGTTAKQDANNVSLAVGATSPATPIETQMSTTSGNYALTFRNPNGLVGNILTSGSSTSFNTSSDYRLKENVTPVADGITRLQQLKPSRFNFKADPTKTVDGFIAHEVQAVVPEAITGEKDALDDDGNPVYQGIDQSKLVPLLTAALQEAITRIEALEAEVQALKGGN